MVGSGDNDSVVNMACDEIHDTTPELYEEGGGALFYCVEHTALPCSACCGRV